MYWIWYCSQFFFIVFTNIIASEAILIWQISIVTILQEKSARSTQIVYWAMGIRYTFQYLLNILFICMDFHRILIISFRLYFLWPLFAQGYWLETIGNSSVKSNLHPEWGRDRFLHIWLVKSSRTKLGWEHGSQYQFLPQLNA